MATKPLSPRPKAMAEEPLSHQSVSSAPSVALWKPAMPVIAVRACVQVQPSLPQEAAPPFGGPASLSDHAWPVKTFGEP